MPQYNNGYMYEKLSNTEAELKKVLLIKNKCVLEKSLTENFIFCAVLSLKEISNCYNLLGDFLRNFFFISGCFFFISFKTLGIIQFLGGGKGEYCLDRSSHLQMFFEIDVAIFTRNTVLGLQLC